MWIDLSKWAKDVKIQISHVNIQQKVTSAEKDFNNQVDRMTCYIVRLSLFIPVIDQWAHEQSDHSGTDDDYTWTQQHELSLTKAPPE